MTNTVEKIDTTSFDDAIRKIWDARDAFYEIKRDFVEIGKNVMANWTVKRKMNSRNPTIAWQEKSKTKRIT